MKFYLHLQSSFKGKTLNDNQSDAKAKDDKSESSSVGRA